MDFSLATVPLELSNGDYLKYKALLKQPVIELYQFHYRQRIKHLNLLLYKVKELEHYKKLN